MMKKLFSVVVLALVSLTGCAIPRPLQTGRVDPGMSALQVKAQAAVNEARRVLISADRLIGDSVGKDIWSPDDGQRYLDQAKAYRKRLDTAQGYVDSNDFEKALTEAGAVQLIADKLLEELVARLPKKPPVKPVSWSPSALVGVVGAEFNPEGRRTW